MTTKEWGHAASWSLSVAANEVAGKALPRLTHRHTTGMDGGLCDLSGQSSSLSLRQEFVGQIASLGGLPAGQHP